MKKAVNIVAGIGAVGLLSSYQLPHCSCIQRLKVVNDA
jgi:hypothetical protein